MTRVVSYPSYLKIGRITRTVSTIIKYVLLISEIDSCNICVLPGYMSFHGDITKRFNAFSFAELTKMKVCRVFPCLRRRKKH